MLAKWNGHAWKALGSNGAGDGAIRNFLHALAVSRTSLYVGGFFTDAAGIATADYVARWTLYRPDGRIRLGAGAFVGNNIYNTTGINQSRTGSAVRGATITFGISIQNDGTTADQFKVMATGSATSEFGVTCFRGATDVTTAVVAGTYQTASLAPGATFLITVKVKVKSTATVGSKVTRLVTLSSVAAATKQDAVKLTGKRA